MIARAAATPLLASAYALIASSAITSVLGVVYWFVAARFYPTTEVGLASAMISTMVFVANIADLGLVGGLGRFVPTAGRLLEPLVRWSYLATISVAVLVCGLVWILGLRPGELELFATPLAGAWFVVACASWAVFVLQDAVLTGLRRSPWVPLENGVFGIAKLALLVALVGTASRWGIVGSWTISTVIVVVAVSLLVFGRFIPHQRRTGEPGEPPTVGVVARFIAGDWVGFLLQQSIVVLLPLLVIAELGPAANAYFYVAFLMAYSLNLIAVGLAQALVVEGSRDPRLLARSSTQVARHLAAILLPSIVVLWFLGPQLLTAIGPAFGEAATVLLRVLAISTVPSGVVWIWVAIARVRRQTGRIALAQAINAIVAGGLTLFLLPQLGITGAGVAWLASQTLMAAGLTVVGIRQFRREGVARDFAPA